MPSRPDWLPVLLLALLAVGSVALSLFVVTPGIALDDPFIGMRYAANLAAGRGLFFNPEDPVEGYTAWLWVMAAWVAVLVHVEPLHLWQVLLVGAQVATLVIVYRLGRPAERSPYRALVAPALLAVHVSTVTWSMLGMETGFFTFLVALAVVLVERRVLESRRGSLALGGVLLLMCLTRFDGLVLVALLLGFVVLVDRDLAKTWPALVVLGIGLAVYNAWRIGYYGELLPNTFYAKQSTLQSDIDFGLRYWARFARDGGPYALLLLSPLLLVRATRAVKLCLWTCFGHFAYVVVVGGDWMKYHRFVLPILPLMCFLMQEGLWRAEELSTRALSRGRASAATALALAVVLAWNFQPLLASGWASGAERRPGPFWHPPDAREVGRYLDRSLPPDALVATEWAGIIPYYMRQPILDIFGLNDSAIIAGDFPGSKMGKGITPEYLVERGPDLVIVVARCFPTAPEALASLDARPPSHVRDFYAALESPGHGYRQCVMEVGPGSYWACLVRDGRPEIEALCVGG